MCERERERSNKERSAGCSLTCARAHAVSQQASSGFGSTVSIFKEWFCFTSIAPTAKSLTTNFLRGGKFHLFQMLSFNIFHHGRRNIWYNTKDKINMYISLCSALVDGVVGGGCCHIQEDPVVLLTVCIPHFCAATWIISQKMPISGISKHLPQRYLAGAFSKHLQLVQWVYI